VNTLLRVQLTTIILVSSIKLLVSQPALVWTKQFDGEPHKLHIDRDGNIYSAGIFSGIVDFALAGQVHTVAATSPSSGYICKRNSSGAVKWVAQVAGTSFQRFGPVITDSNLNVYVSGVFTGSIDADPSLNIYQHINDSLTGLFVIKLDSNGVLGWSKAIKNCKFYNCTITTDKTENVIIGGEFDGSSDFDPGNGVFNLKSKGVYGDIFTCKLNKHGVFVWGQSFGCGSIDYCNLQVTDDNGSIYTIGRYYSSGGDYDPGVDSAAVIAPEGCFFIHKVSGSGQFNWCKTYSNWYSNISGASIDLNGNLVVSGRFTGSTAGATASVIFGTTTLTSNSPSDIFVVKMTSGGSPIWVRQLKHVNWGSDWVDGQTLDENGNIYILGNLFNSGWIEVLDGIGNTVCSSGLGSPYYYDIQYSKQFIYLAGLVVDAYMGPPYDYDPSSVTTTLSPADGRVFIQKLYDCKNQVGLQEIEPLGSLTVFPNPTSREVKVKTNSPYLYHIFSLDGVLIQEGCGDENTTILLFGPPGVYFLRVDSHQFSVRKKVILVKNN
jgi:hypothetical protein